MTRTGMPAQPIAASGPDTGRDTPMDSLHPELALRSGKQPAVWLLEETEADRRTRGRRHRRRRLTRTTRAHTPQAIHEWGGRR